MATRNDEDFEKANAEMVKRSMTQKQAQTGVSGLTLNNAIVGSTVAPFRLQKLV
jgi:hypothetical protein